MSVVLKMRSVCQVMKSVCHIRNLSKQISSPTPIVFAKLDKAGNILKVELSDGNVCDYPYLFLQDNCTCPSCFHSSSKSRLRKMTEMNLQNVLSTVSFDQEKVTCTWRDGHESVFTKQWLLSRRFSKTQQDSLKRRYRVLPTLINSSHAFYRESFKKALSDPQALLELLRVLCNVGVVLLEGAPLEVGQLRQLADKIGFIRLTHYGNEFTVKSEKNAVNLAYTSNTLCVHTDLPYYVYPPGVQLLHCIKQYQGSDGGRSHLVDGFAVAEQLKTDYPEYYNTLCQVPAEFCDIGKDYIPFHKIHRSPTFVMDEETGKLTRIVYSNQQLSSYQPIPVAKVDELYKALKKFTDLCYRQENLIQFKLKEGDVVIFDNWRLLHGRESFDSKQGDRHLEGCYIDWDEIFSKINVLDPPADRLV